jgi:hypothetical protein
MVGTRKTFGKSCTISLGNSSGLELGSEFEQDSNNAADKSSVSYYLTTYFYFLIA